MSTAIETLNKVHALMESGYAADAKRLLEAEFSLDQKRSALRIALNATVTANSDVWICDVYDGWVAYSVSSGYGKASTDKPGTFRRDYTIDTTGKVTLGAPISVNRVMTYEPVPAGQMTPVMMDGPMMEGAAKPDGKPISTTEAIDKNVGGGVDRSKVPAEDFAGKNRSFPIVAPGDVSDAASSIGRAGADNYSSDELKKRIIAIAKRKGDTFMAELPEAWKKEMKMESAKSENSASVDVTGDVIPLCEKAVRKDGTMPVKLIQQGWGSY